MPKGCLILVACGCGAVLWACGPAHAVAAVEAAPALGLAAVRGALVRDAPEPRNAAPAPDAAGSRSAAPPRDADAPAAKDRPTMLDREQLVRWGTEALARIEQDLAQPSSALYAEYGTPDGKRGGDFGKFSFVWPAGFQLRALAAAARVRPREFRQRLVRFAEALDAYWTVRDGIGGYQVLPGKSERFYDDNAWMALGLIETFEVTGQKRFLDRAGETLEFVASGEAKTPGGGIRQHEDKPGNTSVCTTAPATVAALRLYQIRKDRRWLDRAARWYGWLTSKEVGVQDPQDGLFDDQAGYADGRWTVVRGKRAYNTALPMRAAVLLWRVKGEAAYLAEAQRMAAAALACWVPPSGAMHETGQWGGSDLVDALLDLYEADRDPRWPAAVAGILRWLHDNGRDPQGRYGEQWDEDHRTRPIEKFYLLYMAPVARATWRAAAARPEGAPGGKP